HRPLLAGREPGSAPPEEGRGRDLFDELFSRGRQGLPQPLVPAVVEVGAKGPRLVQPVTSGDDRRRQVDGHQPCSSTGVCSCTGSTTPSGAPATKPTLRRTRHSVPWGGISSPRRPAASSSTRLSNPSLLTLPKNRQLTARHGAWPHRAMHSTSSMVKRPSEVVAPALIPSFSSACSNSS